MPIGNFMGYHHPQIMRDINFNQQEKSFFFHLDYTNICNKYRTTQYIIQYTGRLSSADSLIQNS